MAKWRWNGKKLKKIEKFDLDELNRRVKLEPGDMIEIVSGEFPYKSIRDNSNWTLLGNHNRFSVIHSEYIQKGWGREKNILLMPLDESDRELGMIRMHYDPYMKVKLLIFPVDSVDSW